MGLPLGVKAKGVLVGWAKSGHGVPLYPMSPIGSKNDRHPIAFSPPVFSSILKVPYTPRVGEGRDRERAGRSERKLEFAT